MKLVIRREDIVTGSNFQIINLFRVEILKKVVDFTFEDVHEMKIRMVIVVRAQRSRVTTNDRNILDWLVDDGKDVTPCVCVALSIPKQCRLAWQTHNKRS